MLRNDDMKRFAIVLCFVIACMTLNAQQKQLTLDDINIRDPYILPVEKEGAP